VLGDGRELYKSPVMRGSDGKPLEIKVAIAGVKRLTLKVTSADDLDLGDVANWGAALVVRGGQSSPVRKGPEAELEKSARPEEPKAGPPKEGSK
jgi:hypothetical protein